MSILKMRKVTLFGLAKDKSALMDELQSMGCMHLLPLVPPPKEIEKVISPKAERVYKALRFLSDVENRRRQVRQEPGFHVYDVVDKALDLKMAIRRAADKKALLEKRLVELEPWGNIVYPPKAALAGYSLWYYIVPLSKRKFLTSVSLPWQIVHSDNKFAYTVIISKTEPHPNIMPVPRTHVGAKPKSEVLAELEETELLLDELVAKRHGLTRYIYLLSLNLAKADDLAALASASQKIIADQALLVVQGWVTEQDTQALSDFCLESGIACTIEKPSKKDQPPTCLAQPPQLEAATDMAMFYQVPNYRSWDPSWLLFISFSLFFAMILADAGYGLILLILLAGYWRRMGKTQKGKTYRLLASSLCFSTIAYGALVGSYFGLSPGDDSVLAYLHILNINDFDVMMRLSIIVGAIHIGTANVIMAYIHRHSLVAIAKLGWLAISTGGLGYWLASGHQGWQLASQVTLLMGALAIVLCSSERPVTHPKHYLLRLLDGVFSLKALLTVFADVLSYMRLFALGLASASLAMTFNNLASNAYHAVAGGGLLIAILILIIGHALNLLLSLMSGVVHGLRLNYIEFFNWSMAGEGTAFKAFARKEVKK